MIAANRHAELAINNSHGRGQRRALQLGCHVIDKRGHRGAHRVQNNRTARLSEHIDNAEGRAKFCGDLLPGLEMVNRGIAFTRKQMQFDADQHVIMPVEPVANALAGQGDFRDKRKIAAPHAGHAGGQRLIVELVGGARKAARVKNRIGGAPGIDAGMRFNGLDKCRNHLRGHRSDLGNHGLAVRDLRRKNRQVHIAAMKAGSLRQVADRSADADLVMQIVNHFIGDGVVQNAACRPDHKMILKAGIRHHGGKAVNAGAAFKGREIERILKRCHPRLLLHRRIDDDSPPGGLGKPHAGSMAGGGTKNKAGKRQRQHDRQLDQVKPVPPFEPCIKIENHDDLRCCALPCPRPGRARCRSDS